MIYQFVFRDITGASVAFSQFRGKVLLIVNTASACGLTPQYKELEELYEKYKSQGFEVIAFPCNQFAHQEPGSSEDILRFVREKYGVTFPVMEKSDVNGRSTNELFEYLKKSCPGFLVNNVKWNFTKFLSDHQSSLS
ncbi:Glutathione peroxidase [Blastocystis hominis]|uniref:Glutathione peroxidase n=1 Tax=Blastocystis hominis TaxID=12968 RepID=D8MAQ1_BLAHO|nr:Glutathione peroxidase [Blastocystis hominis]CBK25140.2 Glutathione peroxidase [Blastocystis hominis]|eukprot:XP_012899188.1 Glutathione peroxidase [Blastocystis hominis]